MLKPWAAALVALLALSAGARATEAVNSSELLAFDRFVHANGALCLLQPAASCVDAAWTMADDDDDGLLSVEELAAVQRRVAAWTTWKQAELADEEWTAIRLGLIVVQGLGVERLLENFDTDADGRLSRGELLADVTLDRRPLGQVLADPGNVDWSRLLARFGVFSGLLGGAVPQQ